MGKLHHGYKYLYILEDTITHTHLTELVIMEFNVAAGIFHPFATIKQ